jgi:hypothetical protein
MLLFAGNEAPTTGFLCARCLDECETPHVETELAWQHASSMGWSEISDRGEPSHLCGGCAASRP